MVAATLAAALALASVLAIRAGSGLAPGPAAGSSATGTPPGHVQAALSRLASEHPNRQVEVIIQLQPGVAPSAGNGLVTSTGGTVLRDLEIINGLGASMSAGDAQGLSASPAVRAISLNATIENQARVGHRHHRAHRHAAKRRGHRSHRHRLGASSSSSIDSSRVATSYPFAMRADKAWASGYTGKGVGVAVVDTGIAGNLPDFQVSRSDASSRVVASAVVNPGATSAGDGYGHGTHVAGLIAGNGTNRPASDPNYGKYVGVAPDANLIDVKIADDEGGASVLDVIDGLQFAVDYKSTYNIRVVNLSLKSNSSESYRTDPLDAAAEAAWNSGIVVVAAAGNGGSDSDSVSYAPANDPYVITVGAVDDQGNKGSGNDLMTDWSARGATQDGFAKPDLLAPGAHMVSTIAPGSAYTQLCPSCVTDGAYFKVGGTSMAAAVVSGEVADALQANPGWTPSQVKAQIVNRSRPVKNWRAELVDGAGTVQTRGDADVVGGEASLDKVLGNPITSSADNGLTPNNLIDPSTGQIDYTRASWSRASWSDAIDSLRASWSRASWSRASWSRASWSATPETCADMERASWSRASWSRASWSRASWSRASWSADGMTSPDLTNDEIAQIDQEIAAAKEQCSQLLANVDPSRASWSRASWSRASWSTSFNK
jgi:serine protease AprX